MRPKISVTMYKTDVLNYISRKWKEGAMLQEIYEKEV